MRMRMPWSSARTAVELAAPRPVVPADIDVDANLGTYGGSTQLDYTDAVRRLARRLIAPGGLDAVKIAAMRRTPQVSSCLTVRALPLMRADSHVECEDQDIAEWLNAAWQRVELEVKRTMTRAQVWGYSPNALRWTVDPDLGGLVVKGLRDLPADTCMPLVTRADESYAGFVQHHGAQNQETIEPLMSLWLAEGGVVEGNYYGRSLLDAALEPWQDSVAIRLFHLRYLERFGEPVVKARAPGGVVLANEAEILTAAAEDPPRTVAPVYVDGLTRARELGESLRHHSVLALPGQQQYSPDSKPLGYEWDIDFLESSKSGGEDFREALKVMRAEIGHAIFVPDTLFENPDTGTYALGSAHRSIYDLTVEGEQEDFADQLTRHLIERMRVLNFGDRSPAARLVFAGASDTDRAERWQLVMQAAQTGELPLDVLEMARDFGLPVPDDAEAQLAERAAEKAAKEERDAEERRLDREARIGAPVADPAAQLSVRPTVNILREAAASSWARMNTLARDLPDWQKPQAVDPPAAYMRNLTPRESRTVLAAVERELNAAEAAAIDALTELLARQRERALRQVAAALDEANPAAVISALGQVAGTSVAGTYAGPWLALIKAVWRVGLDSIRGEMTAFADAVPADIGPEGRALAKAYAYASAERHLADVQTRLVHELLNAYRSGTSRQGVLSLVGALYDAEATSEGRPLRLTTRMLATRALNEGRADAIERGGIPLAGAQYSAILDRRVCELCKRQDEQVIAITHPDLRRFTPPVHHGCRCMWVYVTTQEADFTPTWESPPSSAVERFGGLVV